MVDNLYPNSQPNLETTLQKPEETSLEHVKVEMRREDFTKYSSEFLSHQWVTQQVASSLAALTLFSTRLVRGGGDAHVNDHDARP